MKPATFRELAAVEAKVFRALGTLSLADRKRVIESVVQQLDDVAAAPVEKPEAAPVVASGAATKPCPVQSCSGYAGHTGEHWS
jgi:hypothetical protein